MVDLVRMNPAGAGSLPSVYCKSDHNLDPFPNWEKGSVVRLNTADVCTLLCDFFSLW
jgi:hypothetical protein